MLRNQPNPPLPRKLCRNWANGEKCHAELASASNKIKNETLKRIQGDKKSITTQSLGGRECPYNNKSTD